MHSERFRRERERSIKRRGPTGPHEDHQTIGVSGGPASTLGPSSSPHPVVVATVTAVVASVATVAAIVTIEIASGTISLRVFALRTRRA
jgi:hypothetical protein